MTKAIIYTRFSPRRDSEKSESIEAQTTICRNYAFQNRLDIVGEFEDPARSGADENRPGLWQAIEALRPGYVLLVTKLDRLARDVYLSIIVEKAIAKHKATIVSTSGEDTNDDPDAIMVRRIIQAISERERIVNAARTSIMMKAHQANGRRMSSKCPIGFCPDPDNSALMIEDPIEQEVIRLVCTLRETGISLRAVARSMNEAGHLCRSGKWHHSGIKSVLERHGYDVEGKR